MEKFTGTKIVASKKKEKAQERAEGEFGGFLQRNSGEKKKSKARGDHRERSLPHQTQEYSQKKNTFPFLRVKTQEIHIERNQGKELRLGDVLDAVNLDDWSESNKENRQSGKEDIFFGTNPIEKIQARRKVNEVENSHNFQTRARHPQKRKIKEMESRWPVKKGEWFPEIAKKIRIEMEKWFEVDFRLVPESAHAQSGHTEKNDRPDNECDKNGVS